MASYFDPPQYNGPSFGQSNRRKFGQGYSGQGYGGDRRTYAMEDQTTSPAGGPANPYTGGLTTDPGSESLEDLYARMGFGESTYRGNNPGYSIIAKMLPALGQRVMRQIGYGNSLQPGKESAISALIRSMSPGNRKAKSAAYGVKAQQDARQSIRNTPEGYGSGFTEGMERDAYNRAGEATRGFDAYQSGPQGEQDALEALMSAFGAGQSSDLDEFLAMLAPDSQNNQFRQTQAGKGSMFGGLSGVLGQLAGGFDWSSILGGGDKKDTGYKFT